MRKILIVTPAPPGSKKGNRITALRWAEILGTLGHQVQILTEYTREKADLLVGLHAYKSYPSVHHFHTLHPNLPLIVALTGTDLYRDIHQFSQARESLKMADYLIVLQSRGLDELDQFLQTKTRVIYQSVQRPNPIPQPEKGEFQI